MYLMPSNSPRINNRKWNLASLGCATCPGRGLACASCGGKWSRGMAVPPQKRMGQLAQGAGVPAGTVLAYSATWSRDAWGGAGSGWAGSVNWNDPNGVQSAIQGDLASQYGIIIDSQQHTTSDYINLSGKSGFVLTVHTTSDYGAPADIQSILDGAIYAVGKTMPQSTMRAVNTAVATSPLNPSLNPAVANAALAAAQAGYQDAVARGDQTSAAMFAKQIVQAGGSDPRGVIGWFSDNWPLLAGVGVGALVLREIF